MRLRLITGISANRRQRPGIAYGAVYSEKCYGVFERDNNDVIKYIKCRTTFERLYNTIVEF